MKINFKEGYTVEVADTKGLTKNQIIDRARKAVKALQKDSKKVEDVPALEDPSYSFVPHYSASITLLNKAVKQNNKELIRSILTVLLEDVKADATEHIEEYKESVDAEDLAKMLKDYQKVRDLANVYGTPKIKEDFNNYVKKLEEAWTLTTDSCEDAKDDYEFDTDMASAPTKDGKQLMASGWTTSTRYKVTEHVKVVLDNKRGYGEYKWLNRPWQKFDYEIALRNALIDLGIDRTLVEEAEDKSSSMNEIVKYIASHLGNETTTDAVDEFIERDSQGHEVKKLYTSDKGRTYVIVYKDETKDFAVGAGYDIRDGKWQQGYYDFKTFDEAEEFLHDRYSSENLTDFDEEKSRTFIEKFRPAKDSKTKDIDIYKNWKKINEYVHKKYGKEAGWDLIDDDTDMVTVYNKYEEDPDAEVIDKFSSAFLFKNNKKSTEDSKTDEKYEKINEYVHKKYGKDSDWEFLKIGEVTVYNKNKDAKDKKVIDKFSVKKVFTDSKKVVKDSKVVSLKQCFADARLKNDTKDFEKLARRVTDNALSTYNKVNNCQIEDSKNIEATISKYENTRKYAKELGLTDIVDELNIYIPTIKKYFGL